MDIKEKINYWAELAQYDIESAKIMLDTRRYFYVAFMCHQSIEKILKAYYWYVKNQETPYIHNLLKLSIYSGIDIIFTKEQKMLINELTPLNIEARYPVDKNKNFEYLNN